MNLSLFEDNQDAGAIFSPCGRYRYRLWRHWSDGPSITWVMLNPSTADATSNDPTVERCCRRARTAGFGAIQVVNIFALRSTDPDALYASEDPVGPDNDQAILSAAAESKEIVCGWGNHGRLNDRGQAVLSLLENAGVKAKALLLTRAGQPGHPLYVAYAVTPRALPSQVATIKVKKRRG